MICPVDGSALQMSERSGIEIDYCPKCRGVWLDRGELDKIIERSAAAEAPPQAPAAPYPPQAPAYPPQAPGYAPANPWGRGHDHQRGYPHKKRKSFLEELFD
jgi:hypothetical protein